jgi:hypothetical protein
MIDDLRSFDTSEYIYNAVWINIPEDRNFQQHRCEYLKPRNMSNF